MEADLNERLRRKREAKYKAKEYEMQEELLQKRRKMKETDRQRRQDLDRKEKEKLEQIRMSLQDDLSSSLQAKKIKMECDSRGSVPCALPVTEQELMMLLLSSPLYQKLDEITVLLQNQSFRESCHTDPKDALWINDTEFHSIDLSSISPKAFVIYKFGCCIIKMLIHCCNHKPVSLLVADRIPPNSHIKQNAFCNSFMYDDKNRILHMRLERLENVGEFILILVHILSHIHIGSLDNDSDPRFVREFYRCLSVCCSDLFLSRYQTTSLAHKGIHEANELWQSTVHDGVKTQFVDDLLDSRLIMDTDTKVADFRLQRYAELKFGSKLRVLLDQLDGQLQDAKYNNVFYSNLNNEYSQELQEVTTTEATRSLDKVAYWRTIAKQAVHESSTHIEQYQQFLEVQTKDLEERIHKLKIEYAQVVKERSGMNEEVKTLEELLSAHQSKQKTMKENDLEFEAQKQKIKKTAIKLSAARTDQATYDLRVNGCLKRLEGFKVQLAQKQKFLKELK